ncbi:YbaK/EbsC family protein [Olsenella sp. YH-ols2217]|uniref:YbaK/EbsC family protein n=1 Tax=Kribbibacterium absianum TaxID=3044210 RepID=A0ABT6ZL21_9ACTN|nr:MULTISPECIES: YbaK/EbsC family protein [unclassified Olsenella]MDJ1121746.1 YbaK/EbsC family protein [Olsenella sp. YH-ols2216]MDJ1129754.1 YbaK/EbsC family protein [Olsenella sp. YH-ols2217]
MAFERALTYLEQRGYGDRVKTFDVSSATVDLAAAALGVEPAAIAKTLSFYRGDRTILLLAAGDARVDNPKFKATFGTKAKMLRGDDVEQRVGHGIGGVCPFGVEDGCDVFLDRSLLAHDTVYPACGNAASAVRLTPEELASVLPDAEWVDVCRVPEA